MAQAAEESRAMESEIFNSKYRRIKNIGKGSFGEAVLVRSRLDGKKYVAKAIDSASMTAKEKRDVQNEIRILAAVSHPNIIRYQEHFEDGSLIFIIMEYADGGDLSTRIKDAKRKDPQEPFDPQLAMFWFLQICMALKYLHDNHILHRDLKTANIFLTSKNVVKLGDFGISTVLQNTIACAKTVCGTPYYFSPELCQSKPYNNKSDVWALGVVFYEMLTLQRPFNAKSLKELLKKILVGQFEPIQSTVPPEMRALCARLLQVNPQQRPSINRILEDLYVQDSLRGFSADLERQAEKDRQEYEAKHANGAHRERAAPPQQPQQQTAPAARGSGAAAPSSQQQEREQREQLNKLRGMNRGDLRAAIAQGGGAPSTSAPASKPAQEASHPDVDDDGDYIAQKKAIVQQTKDIVGKSHLGGHPDEFGDGPSDATPQAETIQLFNGRVVLASEARAVLEPEVGRDMLNAAIELFNSQAFTKKNSEIQRELEKLLGPGAMHNANAITKLALWESKQKASDSA